MGVLFWFLKSLYQLLILKKSDDASSYVSIIHTIIFSSAMTGPNILFRHEFWWEKSGPEEYGVFPSTLAPNKKRPLSNYQIKGVLLFFELYK